MKGRAWVFLIGFFLLFSMLPTGYEIINRGKLKPERYFELVHNFPTDYNFYLSRIRQGLEGRFLVVEKYTSEPHDGSLVHIFYLFLGQIGRWVRVPAGRAGDVYQVARIVLGATLLALMVEFCKKGFERALLRSFINHKSYFIYLAFSLAVTASSWPKLVAVVSNQVVPATLSNIESWRFGGYMAWWSVMDSLQRITFIPHLLAGQALIVFLLMAISDEKVMQRSGNWLFLGLLSLGLGIIFPPGLTFLIAAVMVMLLLKLSWGERVSAWLVNQVVPAGVVLLLSLPAVLYLFLMLSFYPWKRLAEFDVLHPLPFDYWEYAQALGPILPLGLLGLAVALARKEKSMIVSVAWVIAWLSLLIVFRFIPQQSPLRFSEMIPHLPLAVLTAYLFYDFRQRALVGSPEVGMRFAAACQASLRKLTPLHKLLAWHSSKTHTSPASFPARLFSFVICHLAFVIPVALILLGGGVMYSSWLWQRDFVDHKIWATTPLVPTGSFVMYPLADFIAAIKFLEEATSRETVILSETTAGNYIPVYSSNTVYVGHDNTVLAEAKKELVKRFFAGGMKREEASEWLVRERLSVVFFGPQEREDGGIQDLRSVYPFLKEVYKNGYVTVYYKVE